ncbi:MAG: hypothetical protein BGN92_08515 [Sphingobacteriales bacterium 41-5]|mgnify:CR=1 FL=1|nr:MAG: hypothetical protein ABS67_03205 [Niabella sp. SCN 42-15]OJU22582.1 MAG: hypothetical protein BGN92_08515 [Sphingobacteriales bacterium 41-5]
MKKWHLLLHSLGTGFGKIAVPVNDFIVSKPWLSEVLAYPYINQTSRKRIINFTRNQSTDFNSFEVQINKKIFRLNAVLNFYQYLFICVAFLYGFLASKNNFFIGILASIGAYTFFELTFFRSLKSDIRKFIVESYAVIGSTKSMRISQKPQTIEAGNAKFKFYLQDILVIMYFTSLTKEANNSVNFKYLDVRQLEEVLLREWNLVKSSKLNKLLSKPDGKNFDFLNYKIEKNDRNRKANLNRLENISAYFAEKGFIKSKEKFEKYYFEN